VIRRIFAALDRDHVVAALTIVGAVLAYGYVQQADEAAALTMHASAAEQQASQ
jgi:hypothetical protein